VAVGKGGGGEGGERLAAGARRRATEKQMDWGGSRLVALWALCSSGCLGPGPSSGAGAGQRPATGRGARPERATLTRERFPCPIFPGFS